MGIIAISSREKTLLSGSPPSSCPPAAELRPLGIFNLFLPERVAPVSAGVSAQQHSAAAPRGFWLFCAEVPAQPSVVPCCHSVPAGIVPPASSAVAPASAEAGSSPLGLFLPHFSSQMGQNNPPWSILPDSRRFSFLVFMATLQKASC